MAVSDRGFILAVAGFVLVFLALGGYYYAYDWPILRFPLLAGAVTLVLCLACLVQARRRATKSPGEADPKPAPQPAGARRAAARALWIAAVVPMIFVLGFVVGLPLYVLVYLKAHGSGWRLSVCLALGVLATVYLFFVKVMGMPAGLFPAGTP